MKSLIAIATLTLTVASLVADTLQIGAFTLPYRFEDTNITDIVRYVVTNDVIAYKSTTTSFTPPFVEENGNVTVDSENTPGTTLYLPPVFENGIEFRIENGQTNCVIKQSLTDVAKTIEGELPTRTNLVAAAQGFIDNFCSGGTTNLTISEQRALMRTVSGDNLLTMGPDIPDEDALEAQEEMRQHFSFLPICILDTRYVNVGTNIVLLAYVRTDRPQNPSYARSIGALPLVFFDGYWSFLY
ncbi:MAG: hypothetical protein IKH04_02850 [Kiritimatiellae bacterium]|nr:hypothetical protein [Kiritimatiellia bacterium]